jgi:ATP-binding cassette, subfamily B, bacterial PglK
MQFYKKFLYLLSSSERKKVFLLLLMILIMALFEMLGVASIMPFIAVLANPELIETNIIMVSLYSFFNSYGIQNHKEFLFVLGIIVFILLILSIIFKALTMYMQYRFTLMCEYTIGKRLIEGYLHQPYVWFLNRNSSDLGKTILSELNNVIDNGALPMMILLTQSIVFLALFILLILVDPFLTLIIFLAFGLTYALIYKLSRNFLRHIGKLRLKSNKDRFTAVNEAFGSPKELKIRGLENFFINRFAFPAKNYARYQTTAQLISILPRFVLEAFAFGGMLTLILYLMIKDSNFMNSLPIISFYALAGYKIMPAMQQIYNSITRIRFVSPSLDQLHQDYVNLDMKNNDLKENLLLMKNNIILKNVYFNYPNSKKKVLKFDNLKIDVNSKVALVGPTGSGKTTTVDLLLGLIENEETSLEIDGKIINKNNLKAWQKLIGYVPQQIYLTDNTIEANIAYGVNSIDIDQEAIEQAAKISNIHDFVTNELPQKYKTIVGERGVKLSGGQRQRIGLARALYHKPQVLILDEATSALDNFTEKAIMDSLEELDGKITIIMVAHRLSTVKNCDKIFVLDNGKIKASGTFNELVQTNDFFNFMPKDADKK